MRFFGIFGRKSGKNGKYGKIVFDPRLVLHLTTNNNKFIIEDQQMATLYIFTFFLITKKLFDGFS